MRSGSIHAVRFTALVGSLFFLGVLVASAHGIRGSAAGTELVSVSSAEELGDGNSGSGGDIGAAISADGRYVAFQSFAGNLVAGDSNGASDIFLRDRQTGTTTGITTQAASDGVSVAPAISDDGRYIAFDSTSVNLVPGGEPGNDVFVFDRNSGAAEIVSVDSAGVEGDGVSTCPALSADGRYVAFLSHASNLVAGDSNGVQDVFLHDRQTDTTERVSVDVTGADANGISACPDLSGDGRFVAFASSASNLVDGDTTGDDVFLRDRQTGVTTRMSVTSNGSQGSGSLLTPGVSLSADGRFVAFDSFDNGLVPGDTASQDVFVRDTQTGITERVSVDTQEQQGNPPSGYSFGPSISGDGRFVAFSAFSAFVPEDTNSTSDVYMRDRQTGTTTRMSVGGAGEQGDGDSRYPHIARGGRFVAFSSQASNLVVGDTNNCPLNPTPGCLDVFVRDREAAVVSPTPPTPVVHPTALPRTGAGEASGGGGVRDFLLPGLAVLLLSAAVAGVAARRGASRTGRD